MSNSLNVTTSNTQQIKEDFLYTTYTHVQPVVNKMSNGKYSLKSEPLKFSIKTDLKVPKGNIYFVTLNHLKFNLKSNELVGLMMVGWGGNNGSTLTASLIANKKGLKWNTRTGVQSANYFGSVMMSSTTRIGI